MSTISSSTTSTTAYKVTADTTGTLVLQTGATPTTAVTVDASQGVGVGISTPRNFEVSRSDANTTNAVAAAQYPINIRNTDTTANNWASIGFNQGASSLANPVSIGAQFASSTTGSFAVWTSGAEKMRVDSSGNVGIGTTSPSGKLNVISGSVAQLIIGFSGTSASYLDSDSIVFRNAATSEAGRFTSTGLFQFNSGYGSSATAYGCRAWVNFNGTGTVAIRSSGNVTSITDNGVGDYTVNLTNAMPDANYSICGAVGNTTSSDKLIIPTNLSAPTTSAFRIGSQTTAGVYNDNNYVWAAIFR